MNIKQQNQRYVAHSIINGILASYEETHAIYSRRPLYGFRLCSAVSPPPPPPPSSSSHCGCCPVTHGKPDEPAELGTLPNMDISRLIPPMTDNGKLTGTQFDDFATVMVFEPVVDGKSAPGNPLGISLLVNE